jgi:hypothetical protein
MDTVVFQDHDIADVVWNSTSVPSSSPGLWIVHQVGEEEYLHDTVCDRHSSIIEQQTTGTTSNNSGGHLTKLTMNMYRFGTL